MTVRVNKSSFNIREKLSELERPIGLKGSELMRSETAQEARNFVSAGRKNVLINGSMLIYQRGASTGVTSVNNYGPDRQYYIITYGTYTITQQPDAPTGAGFAFSADIDCTTAESPAAGDSLIHRISPLEGYDSEKFAYGTPEAKTSTVSFWIKCSYADSFTLAIIDHDNQRSCFKSFSINQADTWEYKTLTFPGDTSGNGADNNNTLGLGLDLIIGGGTDWRGSSAPEGVWNTRSNNQDSYLTKNSTSFGTSTSHTMNITGVQWEFGHNATEFEHRSYGEELALCQRYYLKYGMDDLYGIEAAYSSTGVENLHASTAIATGAMVDSDDAILTMHLPVMMRARPSVNIVDSRISNGATYYNNATVIQNNNSSRAMFSALVDNGGTMTAGQGAVLSIKGNGYIELDAEL